MPVENGEYIQLSEDQIQSALEDELRVEFGEDIDLTESSVFSTLAEVLGAVLSSNQEESLQEVYESAFLETATGEDLERVVALLGLQRRDAVHATGVEQFQSSGKVQQNYVIQRGTTVQTLGADPVEFETTEVTRLRHVDSFEDGSLSEYEGDLADASIVAANAYDGSNSLELAATSGAHIYDTDARLDQGTVLHAHARPTAGTVPIFTFAVSDDGATYYQVVFDESADEVRLELVENGSVTTTIDTTAVTLGTNYYEAEVTWAITDNIGVSVKNASGEELATLGGVDDTLQRGGCGFKSGDANGTKNLDFYTTSARSADIRETEGGTQGNLGSNTLQAVPSPPAGVQTVTNLYPTGEMSYTDTSGSTFRVGEDEETDLELRQRALNTTGSSGSATHDAIVGNLINEVDGVTSVTIFENKTDTDNTGSGGLPAHSFETVVFGGSDQRVAEAIFDKKAVTARSYGGVNGTGVTQTVLSDMNDQEREISFSRPNQLNIDMTLDLVVNDSYIGDDDLRNRIVRYIGGVLANGGETIGLGVNDDVVIDRIRDIVVGADDTGVIAFDNSVDSDPITTTPSTTVVDGIESIQVDPVEVAYTDATDGSITLNTREQ